MKTESLIGLALVALALYKWLPAAGPVATAPGSDNTAFVTARYQQYLGRGWPLDAGGLEWIRRLDSGENTRAEVEYGIANSPEAINRQTPLSTIGGGGTGGVMGNNQDPSPFWAGGAGGSGWVQVAANNFANWVGGIQLAGYPHITGVIDVRPPNQRT